MAKSEFTKLFDMHCDEDNRRFEELNCNITKILDNHLPHIEGRIIGLDKRIDNLTYVIIALALLSGGSLVLKLLEIMKVLP